MERCTQKTLWGYGMLFHLTVHPPSTEHSPWQVIGTQTFCWMSKWISFILFEPISREDHFTVITLNALSKNVDISFCFNGPRWEHHGLGTHVGTGCRSQRGQQGKLERSGDSSGTPRLGPVTTTEDWEKRSKAFQMQLDSRLDLWWRLWNSEAALGVGMERGLVLKSESSGKTLREENTFLQMATYFHSMSSTHIIEK